MVQRYQNGSKWTRYVLGSAGFHVAPPPSTSATPATPTATSSSTAATSSTPTSTSPSAPAPSEPPPGSNGRKLCLEVKQRPSGSSSPASSARTPSRLTFVSPRS